MRRPGRSRERGAAVPLAVVAIMILLAMGVGLLSLGRTARVYAMRNASDIAARCAADAGLTMALFEMNKKLRVKPWSEGTLPEATDVKLLYSDAVCSYRVTGDLAGGYTIQSFGQSGNANRDVSATIRLQGAFEDAIRTKEQLVLKSGTVVGAYNSLDAAATDIDLDIGSQSKTKDSVVLNNGVVVKGGVFVATGADIDTAIKDLGATTEDKFSATPKPMPQVTAPVLPKKPAINAKKGIVTVTPGDSGSYPQIDLAKGSALEISGGDVVLHATGDIQLGNSCEIIVKDDSTLTIYTDGNIHCRNGSSINVDAPPEQANTLQIYATGQGTQYFDIKAKSSFTGTIYAPNADVDLYAKGDIYGSVVADSFEFKNGGNFYYDEALRESVSVNDDAVIFSVSRWSEGTAEP